MVKYRVKDWAKFFENSESRKIKRTSFVPIPNKHDGKGYRRLMKLKNAGDVFAAWILILQIASKVDERGTLADENGPLSFSDMEDMTGFPAKYFELAIGILSDAQYRICWIVSDEISRDIPASPDASRDIPACRVEQKEQKEQNSTCSEPAFAASEPKVSSASEKSILTFPTAGKPSEWQLSSSLVRELSAAYPGVDVIAESRKALVWVKANPLKKKTASGMPRFLNGWMTRQQNTGGGRRAPPDDEPQITDPTPAEAIRLMEGVL